MKKDMFYNPLDPNSRVGRPKSIREVFGTKKDMMQIIGEREEEPEEEYEEEEGEED